MDRLGGQRWRVDRSRRLPAVVGAAVAVLAGAGPAVAAPAISGADGDVWNVADPVPTYVITSDTPSGRVVWAVPGVDSGTGVSPLTVRLPEIGDGEYRLVARDVRLGSPDLAERAFRVDRTPPTVTVTRPAAGAQVPQGSVLLASYACGEAVTCTGTVPDGAAVDTARPGPATFSVRAVDDAGNETLGLVDFTVLSPQQSPGTAAPSGPIVLTTPVGRSTAARRPALVPRTVNARALRPRAGTVLGTRRPLLRWTARRGARLYNVQIFRLRGSRAITKVYSAFPRSNRLRIPRGRLAPGQRYVWRVWPYVGSRYTRAPLGLSHFSLRRE
jgi:hypothetical protein